MIRCGGVAPRDYPSYFTALAASHFASRGKEPFKGEIFRFIFPLKILLFSDRAHPRKLQITRLALKRKIRSCRYSSPPQRKSLALDFHWAPVLVTLIGCNPGGRKGPLRGTSPARGRFSQRIRCCGTPVQASNLFQGQIEMLGPLPKHFNPILVEISGIEPLASCLQGRRSPS